MKNKSKKSLIIVFSIIILIILIFFGILYYIKNTENRYSYDEKKWINSNSDVAFDVYVEPSLPVFSNSGTGVFYDYINALKEDTGLTFNIGTTEKDEINFENKDSLESGDIVVYTDHFVVLGKNDVSSINDLSDKYIGVLNDNVSTLARYFTEYKNLSFKRYDKISDLFADYNNSTVSYVIIPMYKYINQIIKNDYSIVYHLDDLYSYYCINAGEDSELSSIFNKFYNRYKNTAQSKIKDYFLDIYFDTKNYTELEKENITNDDLIVGYIDNIPYEGKIGNHFTGLTNTYLSKFADMTGATYKYVEYKDIKELNKALDDKKIDIAFNYYSLNNSNYTNSRSLGSVEYVVLAHFSNKIVVNSLYSLTNTNVDMISNMNLKYNMSSKNLFEINDYSSVHQLLKNINEDSVIIVEKIVYDYYKDSSLKNYTSRYTGTINLNNSFLLNNDNKSLNNVFDFYLSTLSSGEINNESVKNVIDTLRDNKFFNFIISNLIYIVIILLAVFFVGITLTKKVKINKKNRKEDRLYYFDAMTNLKNRNFLNDNIEFWNSNKVYPQTIIVLDINNLKALNDREGHEAGDNQIKAVASVLIKTQRDNSEIMRTDGDEFIIYLIGYDEKKISTYIHKLNRELTSELPDKNYGVSIGYSMILNSQTTIDDAINDSINMICKSKGNK